MILRYAGPGELPQQHRQQPGQYFVVVYKNIFTFKGKPTIELNYVFDMHAHSHAEGCSSEYVPMGRNHSEVQDSFLPELGDKPNHPKTFMFPKRKFGDKKPTYRSFQSSWFKKWPWITYNETEDKAFCFACIKAVQQERLRNCALTSKTEHLMHFSPVALQIGKMPLERSTSARRISSS